MMIRRLFMFTSALSLLACAATAVLWARSDSAFDTIELAFARPPRWPARVHSVSVESCQGRLRLTAMVYHDDSDNQDPDTRVDSPRWRWRHSSEREAVELTLDHDQGDGYERESMHCPYGVFEWTATLVPHSRIVLWTAVLPALWGIGTVSGWVAARRRRGRSGSVCAVCGYDLRATPNRCPECGEPSASVR